MAAHDAGGNSVLYAPSAMVTWVFQNLFSVVSCSGQLDYVAEPGNDNKRAMGCLVRVKKAVWEDM